MVYYLGVDVGTSYTAAGVWRDGGVEVVALGDRAPAVPSVVLLRENGEVLTGEAAEVAGGVEPLRLARDFRRRLGDPSPIALDAEAHAADDLTLHLLRGVLDTVRDRQGGAPAGVAASHPLSWSAVRRDLLRRTFERAGLGEVTLVSDPHAAALHHGALDGFVPGSVVAVYDLGGGTFDAAVLCATDTGWELLGRPEGIDRLGGVDVDDILFNHVADSLGGALEVLDPDDPTHLAAVARLRRACVEAKEALSTRDEVPLAVAIPTMLTTVRLSRSELEKMVRPALARSVAAFDRTLRSAGVETSDLTAVLLMGGASRMPLVADLLGEQLERPVAIAAEPKLGVALGTAMAAAARDVPDAPSATRIGAADGAPAHRETALATVGSPPSGAAAGQGSAPGATAAHAGSASGLAAPVAEATAAAEERHLRTSTKRRPRRGRGSAPGATAAAAGAGGGSAAGATAAPAGPASAAGAAAVPAGAGGGSGTAPAADLAGADGSGTAGAAWGAGEAAVPAGAEGGSGSASGAAGAGGRVAGRGGRNGSSRETGRPAVGAQGTAQAQGLAPVRPLRGLAGPGDRGAGTAGSRRALWLVTGGIIVAAVVVVVLVTALGGGGDGDDGRTRNDDSTSTTVDEVGGDGQDATPGVGSAPPSSAPDRPPTSSPSTVPTTAPLSSVPTTSAPPLTVAPPATGPILPPPPT